MPPASERKIPVILEESVIEVVRQIVIVRREHRAKQFKVVVCAFGPVHLKRTVAPGDCAFLILLAVGLGASAMRTAIRNIATGILGDASSQRSRRAMRYSRRDA